MEHLVFQSRWWAWVLLLIGESDKTTLKKWLLKLKLQENEHLVKRVIWGIM